MDESADARALVGPEGVPEHLPPLPRDRNLRGEGRTITFKAVGNKTELTMRSELMTAAMKKRAVEEFRAIEGGKQTLSRLNAHVTGQFVIFRLVDAPRERVWRAWTSEKELGRLDGDRKAPSPATPNSTSASAGPITISLYWSPIEPSQAERETFAKGMDGMKGGWSGSFERLEALLKEVK